MTESISEKQQSGVSVMQSEQEVSPGQTAKKESVGGLKKFSFNISMDNLRPFVGEHDRTHRKKKLFQELSGQRRARRELGTRCVTEGALTERRKGCSPDLPVELSNCILQQIERRGLHCSWKEGEDPSSREAEPDSDGQLSRVEWSSGEVGSDLSFAGTPRQVNQSSSATKLKHLSLASTSQVQGGQPQYYMQYQPYFQYSYSFYQRSQSEQQYYAIYPQMLAHDPRTTLMIKNIPNKYTIRFLAEEIDRHHHNTYDFLYLPYDMKNNCNVGYGFINFVSTEALSQFYHHFHNKKWNKFHSQKICQLTYARLQGLNALIEHFQNSKVLTAKDKKYQPIIREFSKIESLLKEQKQKTNYQF